MKTYLVLLLLFATAILAQSTFQKQLPIVESNANKTFFEIVKEFKTQEAEQNIKNGYVIRNGVQSKVPNWKIFKRQEWFWENRINTETGEFPKTNSLTEYNNYKKNKSSKITADLNENWINLGTSTSTGGYAGLGRINCVAFHPTDVNTFWVGSPSGGIWETTDGGSNWTILNNNEDVLGVSDIAVTSDYATSQTLYIATGDRDGGSMSSLGGGQAADNSSIGVLKSTDGGTTWNATGLAFSSSENRKVTRLLIHPSNNLILFASVIGGVDDAERGILKSTDGGATWVKKTGNF